MGFFASRHKMKCNCFRVGQPEFFLDTNDKLDNSIGCPYCGLRWFPQSPTGFSTFQNIPMVQLIPLGWIENVPQVYFMDQTKINITVIYNGAAAWERDYLDLVDMVKKGTILSDPVMSQPNNTNEVLYSIGELMVIDNWIIKNLAQNIVLSSSQPMPQIWNPPSQSNYPGAFTPLAPPTGVKTAEQILKSCYYLPVPPDPPKVPTRPKAVWELLKESDKKLHPEHYYSEKKTGWIP
jgi:hypothetical protein